MKMTTPDTSYTSLKAERDVYLDRVKDIGRRIDLATAELRRLPRREPEIVAEALECFIVALVADRVAAHAKAFELNEEMSKL